MKKPKNAKKVSSDITLNPESVKEIVEATFVILNAKVVRMPNEAAYRQTEFLKLFIEKSLLQTLNRISGERDNFKNQDEFFDYAINEVGMLKELIQNSISDAFRVAMKKFSGEDLEYYCIIKPVQSSSESVN